MMDRLEPNAYFLETSLQLVAPTLDRVERSSLPYPDADSPSREDSSTFLPSLAQDWHTLDEQATALARLLGLFAAEPIPWLLVEQVSQALGWEEAKVDIARMRLYDIQFLELTDQGYYVMPVLVRDFVCTQLLTAFQAEELRQGFATAMAAIAAQLANAATDWLVEDIEATLPHLLAAATNLTAYLGYDNMAWCFIAAGRFYVEQGSYAKAEPGYEQCLSILQARFDLEHPAVVICLNNLAYLYEQQSRFEEAEPLYLKAIALGQQLLGDEHLNVATSLNNLAGLYKFQGRYSEAEPLYIRSRQIREQTLGESHLSVATSLNNLAGLYYEQGRYEDAELLYLKALRLRRCQLGDAHPSIAISLNNLASTFYARGRYEQAVSMTKQAVQLSESLLGAYHPDTLMLQSNLARMQAMPTAYLQAQPWGPFTGVRRFLGHLLHHPRTQD